MASRINPSLLKDIRWALEKWEEAVDSVDDAQMTPTTKNTYKDHPGRFVRWLAGEYDLPSVGTG